MPQLLYRLFLLMTMLYFIKTDDDSCYPNCVTLSFTQCTVCYSNCEAEGFQMKTCQQEYCAEYTRTTNSTGHVTTQRRCTRYQKRYLSEQRCTQKCCGYPDYDEFTQQTFNQCVQYNQNATKIALIVVGVIAGVIVLVIICYFLCCKWGIGGMIVQCCQGCIECCCQLGDICRKKQGKNQQKQQKYRDQPNNENKNNQSYQITSNEMMKMQPSFGKNKINPNINVWKERDSKFGRDDQNFNQNICSICLGHKADCITDCNHCYHVKCLTQWVKKNTFCPLCITHDYNPVKLICQYCQSKQMKVYVTEHTQLQNLKIKDNVPVCPQCQEINIKPYFPQHEHNQKDIFTKNSNVQDTGNIETNKQ